MEHPLKVHLRAAKVTQTEFAATVGTTPSYLNQILTGYRAPSKKFAREIERATGGVVSAAALLLWEPEREPIAEAV